jgi:magnesium-transporting ATPase (P-type)
MTTAVLLGLMLAFEPKEAGLMNRLPLDPRKPILTGVLIMRIVLVGFMLLVEGHLVYLSGRLDRDGTLLKHEPAQLISLYSEKFLICLIVVPYGNRCSG